LSLKLVSKGNGEMMWRLIASGSSAVTGIALSMGNLGFWE
jgi:hypothetical protein